MVDYELLNKVIEGSGLSRKFLASSLDITRTAFWQKCNGEREFKQSELQTLKTTLSLTNSVFRRVFFATERESKATKEVS